MDDWLIYLIVIPVAIVAPISFSYIFLMFYCAFTEYLSEKISKNATLKLLALVFSIVIYIFLIWMCIFYQSNAIELFKYITIIGALTVFILTITLYYFYNKYVETPDISDPNYTEKPHDFFFFARILLYLLNFTLYIFSIIIYFKSKTLLSLILLSVAFFLTSIIFIFNILKIKLKSGIFNETALASSLVILCLVIIVLSSLCIHQYTSIKNLKTDYISTENELNEMIDISHELYEERARLNYTENLICCTKDNDYKFYHKAFYCFGYNVEINNVFFIDEAIALGLSPCPTCYK